MIEGLNAVALDALSRVDRTGVAGQGAGGAGVGNVGDISFTQVLREQMAATASTVKTAEATAIRSMTGQMDARAVADAVMEAERNLQAAVAIRDKIVTAYLDMTRMAI
ncbi:MULTISPECIES: flagellar hook-basal body complex protein FliE [unclassified Roseitalea]|uniref:flagellar hook-basal body complex protein FliE n=1 Tax=unclassified Roseitalea TaxID=2639107 RepID=UPI00273D55C4|nr:MULTISPECIES: flagellar hook-basal body complex protein FliE [unclassified Roseitalea]